MIETTLIALLIGFGAGFYIRSRDAKRRNDAFEKHIGALQGEIENLHNAELSRQNEAARRRRFFEENDVSDVENQIRFIRQTELHAVRPVNREAAQVLYALDEWIEECRPEWRVAFEVSMGSFIKTSCDANDAQQKAAFSSYNSKRVDFLLIDRFGMPTLAVEYHGSGHELSDDAEDRMQVKRLALERAEIPLVEIPAKATRNDIKRMISDCLTAETALPN